MTRRGYVAGALAVLVLLVVPLGLVPYVVAPVPADGPAARQALPRSVAGDPAVAESMSCSGSATPAAAVPGDVVATRMCAIDNRVTSWFGPQDGLHSGLGDLVEVLAGLEPLPESTDENRTFCTDDGGIAFELRLALAAGDVVSIPGDTGGCSTVTIGGRDVGGSDEVLASFLSALAEQRRTAQPPAALVELPLACGQDEPDRDHRLSLIGDPADFVRAITCWRPNAAEVGPWRGERPVPARELARLVEDISLRRDVQEQFSSPDCPGGKEGYYWQDLVGQTRWGDVVAARGVCRELLTTPARFWRPGDEDLEQYFWHPSPAAQRILDGLRR